ncbi:MAG TPA: hypothetical protein VMZ91_01835 [Candidatus Paceibacterota bacterium]|nr:hypothetical protein [Candidatus Paceibacterota bacterium]
MSNSLQKNTTTIQNCLICKHPGKDSVTEYYFSNEKRLERTKKWFEKKYKIELSTEIWEEHFEEHIKPFYSVSDLSKIKKMNKLRGRTIAIQDNSNRIAQIMEMLWEKMCDVYTSDINGPKEMNATERRKDSKELIDLSKSFREYHQMNLEVMSLGRTPDEQIKAMNDYLSNVIDALKNKLEGNPEAQRILDNFISGGIKIEEE